MSFEGWLRKGVIKPHQTSKQELENLLGVVERCLADANVVGVSVDGRFQSAYNAAHAAATTALHAAGYRTNPGAAGHHAITLESLGHSVLLSNASSSD